MSSEVKNFDESTKPPHNYRLTDGVLEGFDDNHPLTILLVSSLLFLSIVGGCRREGGTRRSLPLPEAHSDEEEVERDAGRHSPVVSGQVVTTVFSSSVTNGTVA